MKKSRFARLFALLLCCALLCACGAGKQSETVNLPAATPDPMANTPSPAPTPTPAMPEAEQRALIERNRSLWTWPEPNYETWFYAFTDLDRNGRLEVLTASLQGSGLYTYVECWEVNPNFNGLVRCYDDTAEGQAWPDIIMDMIGGYCDPATGRCTYVCDDFTRDGAARYYRTPVSFCLHDGRIELRTLASMEEIYDANGASVKYYYNISGSPISEAEYNAAADSAFAGQEKITLNLSWTQVEPQPAATPVPTPQYAQPVIITKNPTSESLTVGDRTWFIAHADNADTLTWELLSPEGRVCSAAEAAMLNPGLELEVLEGDTIALRNVPASLNNWSVRARFDGPGGSAVTSAAYVYVTDWTGAYQSVLKTYYDYSTGKNVESAVMSNTVTGDYYLEYEGVGVSYLSGYDNNIGYCFQDLDGNGIPELLIGSTDDLYGAHYVFDLFTLSGGVPKRLATSGERTRYSLLSDGRLFYVGSGGAAYTVFLVYQVEGDSFYVTDGCVYDDGQSYMITQQKDGYFGNHDTDIAISGAELQTITSQWENSAVQPNYTPIYSLASQS